MFLARFEDVHVFSNALSPRSFELVFPIKGCKNGVYACEDYPYRLANIRHFDKIRNKLKQYVYIIFITVCLVYLQYEMK